MTVQLFNVGCKALYSVCTESSLKIHWTKKAAQDFLCGDRVLDGYKSSGGGYKNVWHVPQCQRITYLQNDVSEIRGSYSPANVLCQCHFAGLDIALQSCKMSHG